MTRIGISAIHIRPGKCGSHEPYLVNLIHSLSEIDKENQYLIFVNPTNISLFSGLGSNFNLILCSKLTNKIIIRILYEQFILPIKIYYKKIDVAHFPGNIIPIFHPFYTVVTIHTDSIRARSSMGNFQRYYYDLFLRINRRADKIISPTNIYAEQLIEFYCYDPNRIISIHHGCNNIYFENSLVDKLITQRKWGIEEGAILSVTNTLPHKNIPLLLKGIEKLFYQYNLDPQLVLVGYIDKEKLNQYIKLSSMTPDRLINRIKVIPYVNNNQLSEIYNASSIFVLPSKEESFGMPIIEALASHIPCAVSDIPTFKEVAGSAALYFDPNNPDDIAKQLDKLISQPDLCEDLIRKGERIATSHTWLNTAKLTLFTYLDAILW